MLAVTKSSGVLTDTIRSSLSTYNYSQLSQIGYWYRPTNWKTVKIPDKWVNSKEKETRIIRMVITNFRFSLDLCSVLDIPCLFVILRSELPIIDGSYIKNA